MRGLKITKQVLKRPDTPLAPTPKPAPAKKPVAKTKVVKKVDNNGGYATGVVISRKDELAHPEDFKYLKKNK
jgi:hypothetical protein